jgi:hypothetical protein
MAENMNSSTPVPGQTIDLLKETDVGYWCEIFGIDPTQLRQAVGAAGPQAVDVARHLRSKQQGGDRA